jgi:hypothetical protein
MNYSALRSLPRRIALLAAPVAFLFLFVAGARAETASPTPPAVDHYVYLRFLPKASELAQDAKMNGLTILRIDELPDRVIVSYQYPDGHKATLGYALLGSNVGTPSRAATAATATPASTTRYVVSERDPEVVYVAPSTTTTRVYYYDDPWYDYWGPVTLGFGLGWTTGYFGGHHHDHGSRYHSGYYGGNRGGGHHGGHGHRGRRR